MSLIKYSMSNSILNNCISSFQILRIKHKLEADLSLNHSPEQALSEDDNCKFHNGFDWGLVLTYSLTVKIYEDSSVK